MIRKAILKDVNSIEDTYNEHFQYELNHTAFTVFKKGVYPTKDDAERAIYAGALFVYEENGTIVGSIIIDKVQPIEYATIPWKEKLSEDEVMVIHLLMVRPSMSGKGIASSLIKFATELAQKNSCRALRLDTGSQNIPALSLYQKNGFEKLDAQAKRKLKDLFVEFYMNYLERNLAEGEKRVFRTAISILIMKIQGQTFRNICHRRYAYISKMQERKEKERLGISTDSINAQFSQKCQDLPNGSLIHPIPLFGCGTKAREVDYDIVTYDTYDYLDKVINLYLSDIFYAAFLKSILR